MKLAVFVTEYPAISHTFIDSELEQLVGSGLEIDTFSLNRPATIESRASLRQIYDDVTIIRNSKILMVYSLLRQGCLLLRNAKNFVRLFQIHRANGRSIKYFQYLAGASVLAYHLKRRRINHLHVHFVNAALNIAIIAKQFYPLYLSCTIHGPTDFHEPNLSFLERTIDLIDGVRFIGMQGMSKVNIPVAVKRRCKIIHCGIDTNLFKFVPRSVTDGPKILSVIRLAPQKNPLMIIEVGKQLRKSLPNFNWTVIGGGLMHDELQSRTRAENLDGVIKFVGSRSLEQVRDAIYDSDFCALTSIDEGTPIFLMESMACGRLVISTEVGNIPELITNGHSGYIAPSTNAGAMAEKFIEAHRLARDRPEEFATIIQRARVTIERDFDIRKNMKIFQQWIGEIGTDGKI